jgi:hypothetical protein
LSGILLSSALLSFQLDKIYAQSSPIAVDITASVPPCAIDLNEDKLPDELDCAASDNEATVTGLDPQPLNPEFSLDCETHIEDDDEIPPDQNPGETDSLAASCSLDGDDWNANVSCFPPVDPFTTGTNNLNDCFGSIFFFQEDLDIPE